MADVMITGVWMVPNPIAAGGMFVLSVEVADIVYALLAADGDYLQSADGAALERLPRKE